MKVSALILVSICTSGAALAQNITVPHGGGAGTPLYLQAHVETPGPVSAATAADRLASELGLDQSEAARLRVILDEQQLQLDEFIRDQEVSGKEPTAEAVMAIRQKLQDESLNKLRSVLTPQHLHRLTAIGGAKQLLTAPEGVLVRADSRAAYCDATGKCVAR